MRTFAKARTGKRNVLHSVSMWRPRQKNKHKFERRWQPRVFPGMVMEWTEWILVTAEGVYVVQSTRRKPSNGSTDRGVSWENERCQGHEVEHWWVFAASEPQRRGMLCLAQAQAS